MYSSSAVRVVWMEALVGRVAAPRSVALATVILCVAQPALLLAAIYDCAPCDPVRKKGIMLDARIVSPQGRFPRDGEVIRLSGTVKWHDVPAPDSVHLTLRDSRRLTGLGKVVDQRDGRTVSIVNEAGTRSGVLRWEGEVKASLRGEGDVYSIEIAPIRSLGGGSQGGFYRDDRGGIISATVPLRVHGRGAAVVVDAWIVSPLGRAPHDGEAIRLRGVVSWRNAVPPDGLEITLWDGRWPGVKACADQSEGRITSIKKRNGGRSGALVWEGEVKANLRGVGDVYYVEVVPMCEESGGDLPDEYYRDDQGDRVSSILVLKVRDRKRGRR